MISQNPRITVLRTVQALRQWRDPHRLAGRRVGLVPTMGALHGGHLSLVRLAAAQNHHVVVSIFVNPAQFGAQEDLSSYPRTWDADMAALETLDRELSSGDGGRAMGKVSAVFAPPTEEMYPEGFPGQEVNSKGSFVNITPLGEVLEGRSRPTFFRGVATVCMKLFNAVQPEAVYFGQKDAQQTVLIRKLVRDFLLPIDVVVGPTMREEDGMAASSRNVYLGARRRRGARVLSQALAASSAKYDVGVNSRADILDAANSVLDAYLVAEKSKLPSERVKFELDYLSLADPDKMEEVQDVDSSKGAIISGAIRMLPVEEAQPGEDLGHGGGPPVRLIDNMLLLPKTR